MDTDAGEQRFGLVLKNLIFYQLYTRVCMYVCNDFTSAWFNALQRSVKVSVIEGVCAVR